MRPSSAAVTSARHSRRPPRIRRNSSWPGCVSEPTVAARAEITPSSGATTRVCERRSSSACTLARAATTRDAAVFSAVRYWLICCLVNAPSGPIWRARSAFAVASAAVACASASAAFDCASSASMVSLSTRARIWPFFTRSPTFASTSVRRWPLISEPITASCQAAMLPLAASVCAHSAGCSVIAVTLSAGLGPAAPLPSAGASRPPEKINTPRPARITTATAASAIFLGVIYPDGNARSAFETQRPR